MSKYIAGIRPLDTAYDVFEIKPCLCGLDFIKCTVPSIKGNIELELKKDACRVHMRVVIPAGTKAEVYLPLTGEPPCDRGHEFTLNGGYAKFILDPGEYEL